MSFSRKQITSRSSLHMQDLQKPQKQQPYAEEDIGPLHKGHSSPIRLAVEKMGESFLHRQAHCFPQSRRLSFIAAAFDQSQPSLYHDRALQVSLS